MKTNSSRRRRAATSPPAGEASCCKDRISPLPDDVLISIISRLTVQEATITRLLSKRWRHLCDYITRLDFDIPKPKKGTRQLKEFDQKKFDWINRVLDTHRGGHSLREFKTRILGLKGVHINRWFEFALKRGVEILDINLELYPNKTHGGHLFPIEALIKKYGLRSLRGLRTLKVLSLIHVDLDDRAVELLLSNCNVLERLSLSFSSKLRKVSVVGCPSLKHLEICDQDTKSIKDQVAKTIEIRDLNLVSFRYRGRREINLIVGHVPKLIEIDVEYSISNAYLKILRKLSRCIHQIEHLTLVIDPLRPELLLNWVEQSRMPNALPELINLKHLVLEVFIIDEPYIVGLTPLIKASPLLQKLEVKFLRSSPAITQRESGFHTEILEQPHYNLKTVTFSGYLGSRDEIKFTKYILVNAVKLEQFVVEPYHATSCGKGSNVRQQATAHARKQFREKVKVPKSVNFVLI
ncbi:hypothetical protein BUALT_Bualt07G0124700 [Buddleja alternifolia]|uniref:F-box domain-containing protein n=1 Tax=Buddleja alternifolia TaxID=168488 RepID=A0AAV6XH81_9LAMI|nr:hypothetical protein BUALT_Bualt07G0124700 [Buddleja alternifolia]